MIRFRAERILGKAVTTCYRFNDNPNIIECHLVVGGIRYVDLSTKKEVDAALLKVQVVKPENQVVITKDVPEPKVVKKRKTTGEKKTVKKTKK